MGWARKTLSCDCRGISEPAMLPANPCPAPYCFRLVGEATSSLGPSVSPLCPAQVVTVLVWFGLVERGCTDVCVCSCEHRPMCVVHGCTCVYACMCLWRIEVNLRAFLSHFLPWLCLFICLFVFVLRQGLLAGPGAHRFGEVSWPATFRNLPVSASPALRF